MRTARKRGARRSGARLGVPQRGLPRVRPGREGGRAKSRRRAGGEASARRAPVAVPRSTSRDDDRHRGRSTADRSAALTGYVTPLDRFPDPAVVATANRYLQALAQGRNACPCPSWAVMDLGTICHAPIEGASGGAHESRVHPTCLAARLPQDAVVALGGLLALMVAPPLFVWAG